jgi:Uncharacterised BCR, YnfA/UPF0060 family
LASSQAYLRTRAADSLRRSTAETTARDIDFGMGRGTAFGVLSAGFGFSGEECRNRSYLGQLTLNLVGSHAEFRGIRSIAGVNRVKSLLWYLLAASGEIGGCFSFWAWLRLQKGPLWVIPGVGALVLFAWALTRVEAAAAGRAYAAYGVSISCRPCSGSGSWKGYDLIAGTCSVRRSA